MDVLGITRNKFYRPSIGPAAFITMMLVFTAGLTVPRAGFSLDLQVAQPAGELEQEAVEQDEQPAQDLMDQQVSGLDLAGDADLTLIVPLQIENLHPTVDEGRITCMIQKFIGEPRDFTLLAAEAREFVLEGGAYSNTFTFFFTAPPDLTPEYSVRYMCFVALKDRDSEDRFMNVWTTATNADILQNVPAWSVVSDESNTNAHDYIDW